MVLQMQKKCGIMWPVRYEPDLKMYFIACLVRFDMFQSEINMTQ